MLRDGSEEAQELLWVDRFFFVNALLDEVEEGDVSGGDDISLGLVSRLDKIYGGSGDFPEIFHGFSWLVVGAEFIDLIDEFLVDFISGSFVLREEGFKFFSEFSENSVLESFRLAE